MRPSIAYTVLARARAEGYTLAITPHGTIRARAPSEGLDDLLSQLRKHKPACLLLLEARPSLGGTQEVQHEYEEP